MNVSETAVPSNKEAERNIEVARLRKTYSKQELAVMVVDHAIKLRHQISISNRYFDIIAQRDKTIRDQRLQLATFNASNLNNPRRALMAQSQKYAIETGQSTRINGDRIEAFDEKRKEWYPIPNETPNNPKE